MPSVAAAREQMLNQQVRAWDVLDPTVLNAMRRVPREHFVPSRYRELAFADTEIPLAHGESMLAPKVEGRLLQALALEKSDHAFEIGTGSGYLTACLASLVARVLSFEFHEDLSAQAADRLRAQNLHSNIELVHADIAQEVPNGEYDAVLVGGAMTRMDERLLKLLGHGGRLVAVVGDGPVMEAQLYTRTGTADWRVESLFDTVLQPLHGYAAAPGFSF